MAEGPPPTPTPIRTETKGPIVTGIGIGFIVVNVVFTSLRFYTRATILKAIGKDDWAILVATILAIVYSVALFYEVKYGMGRHVENVTMAETLEQLKFLMLGITSYNAGMNVAKLGFLFQYRRIFHDKLVRTVCFWFIIYVCFWFVLQITLLFLACFPISIIVPSMAGKCLDTLPVWYASSVMSMVTDILIFCIPLPSVWKLQLPTRQRILVMGIFCLGFFVCIISVYRLSTLYSGVVSPDPSWDNIGAAIWSAVELGVSILASNLPTLRPLLARLLPGIGLTSDQRYRSSYMRYGRSAQPGGPQKSNPTRKSLTGERGGRSESVGTEELALREMDPERGGSVTGNYAIASSNRETSFAAMDHENSGQIIMTTDITVNSGRR